MVVGGFCEEVKSPLPPAKLWKAAVVDLHNLVPKLAPEFIASMEVVKGDGGVGTIKLITFTPAVKILSSVKIRVDKIDEANFDFKYSVVEGNSDKFDSTSYGYKFEPSKDGGSLCKVFGEYTTVGEYVPTEEEKIFGKESFIGIFKAIEAYIQANPDENA